MVSPSASARRTGPKLNRLHRHRPVADNHTISGRKWEVYVTIPNMLQIAEKYKVLMLSGRDMKVHRSIRQSAVRLIELSGRSRLGVGFPGKVGPLRLPMSDEPEPRSP